MKMLKNNIKKVIFITGIIYLVIGFFPNRTSAKIDDPSGGGGSSDMLVNSEESENTKLRLELRLYKGTESDNTNDYYLVIASIFEVWYSSSSWVNIWDMTTTMTCWTSSGTATILEAYRDPDPGIKWYNTNGQLFFYNVRFPINLPAGKTTWSRNGNTGSWNIDAYMDSFGNFPVTQNQVDFSLVFKVPQGADVDILVSTYADWYKYYVVMIYYKGEGSISSFISYDCP